MWSRIAIFVVGAAIGWLVGARSGHQAYERLASAGARAWQSPGAQNAVDTVRRTVRRKATGADGLPGDLVDAAAETIDDAAARHDDSHEG